MLWPKSEEIILKFRFLPKLSSNEPKLVKISPAPGFIEDTSRASNKDVEFIKLEISPTLIDRPEPIVIGYWPNK